MVHGGALAGWAVLPALRLSQYPVRHRASDHDALVRGDAGTQGIESFWAMLKRAIRGHSTRSARKHMDRYVTEFAGRHNAGRPTRSTGRGISYGA